MLGNPLDEQLSASLNLTRPLDIGTQGQGICSANQQRRLNGQKLMLPMQLPWLELSIDIFSLTRQCSN